MRPKLSIPVVRSQISTPYSPKLIATLNAEYDVKVARTKGGFVWHSHTYTDELIYILRGSLTIEIEGEKGREDVVLDQGELFVVPRGRHRPVGGAVIMLIERVGVVNAGDSVVSESTRKVEDARVVK